MHLQVKNFSRSPMVDLCKDGIWLKEQTAAEYDAAITQLIDRHHRTIHSEAAQSREPLVLLLILVMKRLEWLDDHMLGSNQMTEFFLDFVCRAKILITHDKREAEKLKAAKEKDKKNAELAERYRIAEEKAVKEVDRRDRLVEHMKKAGWDAMVRTTFCPFLPD